MITVSIVQVGVLPVSPHTDPLVLTTEPNDETRSPLLCSLVREQDRRERRRRVIPGAVSEQRSWSGCLFCFCANSHSRFPFPAFPVARSQKHSVPGYIEGNTKHKAQNLLSRSLNSYLITNYAS